MSNPLRYDPSRTATLRRVFSTDLNKRLTLLQQAITEWLEKELTYTTNAFDPNEPRDKEGKWTAVGSSVDSNLARYRTMFKPAGDIVDGREVLKKIPNLSSIDSSINDSEILPGIKEVPLSVFGGLTGESYSASETQRIIELADKIKQSGKISPLIVVIDGHPDGPYVLEGGHRVDALFRLGAKSFPAKVVLDLGDIEDASLTGNYDPNESRKPAGEQGGGQWTSGGGTAVAEEKINIETGLNDEIKIKERFGWSLKEVAEIAGATSGANVVIAYEGSGIHVEIEHPLYVANRRIYKDHIHNMDIEVNDKGKGIGTELFHRQVLAAAKHGIEYIEADCVRLSDMNGYYTWARLGYDAPLERVKSLEMLQKFGADFVGNHRVSDLMSSIEGRKWWKENGTGFGGTFDLKKDSLSRKVLDAYVKEKQSRATTNLGRRGRGNIGQGLGRFEQTINARYRYTSLPERVEAFRNWLAIVLKRFLVPDDTMDAYWRKYVEWGVSQGAGRSYDDFTKAGLYETSKESKAFFMGGKRQFLASAFSQPEAIEKVKLLAGRVFTELKGFTEWMAQKLVRTLTDGLVKGEHPRTIASQIRKEVGISASRAKTIARTEILRAHAQGQIISMRSMGVTKLGVSVEWVTAAGPNSSKGYPSPCKLCKPLKGVVLTIEEADGLLPRHPNCFTSAKVAIYTADGWKPLGQVRAGDLVLTHKGRFRKVIQLHRNSGTAKVTQFKIGPSSHRTIQVTSNHPIMVNGKWTDAGDIKVGDKVRWLASSCKGCGADLPFGFKYCGVHCQWKNEEHCKSMSEITTKRMVEGYASGRFNGKEMTQAANAKVRELIANGEFDHPRPSGEHNGAKQPLARLKISLSKRGDNNPMRKHKEIGTANGIALSKRNQEAEKHPNGTFGKKGFMTSLEKRIHNALLHFKLTAVHNYRVGKYRVDFALLKKKIAVECDGEQWHKDKERDAQRDAVLAKFGWTVIRFTEKEIKSNPYTCVKKVIRILNNHSGNYRFAEFEVKSVATVTKPNLRLFNLSVEEDESYIAKGCVVHNCLCALIPANVGESKPSAIKTKSLIDKAFDQSIRAEIPKKARRRSVKTQRKLSRWVGAGKKISKTRPKSILED